MRKINTKPAATAKPVSTTAKLAARVIASVSGKPKTNASKPVPAKQPEAPAPVIVKPVTVAKPADTVASAERVLARHTARDTTYLASAAYPAEHVSADDTAYLALFASFAKAATNGICSIAVINASGHKPAGYTIRNNRARLVRLEKLGLAEYISADKLQFKLTDKARGLAAYTTAKPL